MNRSAYLKVLISALMMVCSISFAFGQGGTGELTGRVTDPSGAIVSDSQVTLINNATHEKRTAVTSMAGTFRFAALPVVGTYTLEVSAKGFRTARVADIVISVGTIATHDVALEVGTASEVVTVEAGAQLVQTQDSSLSGLVNNTVWQQMPLETRSQNEFIALLPGAEPAALEGMTSTTDRGAAVNGARSGTGNFLVEGFDNNDQGLGGAGASVGPGGANTTIDPDAIQEYRVIEHIPSAEYGKAGGFVTDTVLKSGTNNWHGSLFEYNRMQTLAANSWFSDRSNLRDHLVRNQFGGSVGGPIIKDKAFFFFSGDGHRERSSSPLTAHSFTPDFVNFVKSGAFETFMESDPAGLCNNSAFITAFDAQTNSAVPVGPCPGAFSSVSSVGSVFSALQSKQHMPLCSPTAANCAGASAGGQGLYTGGALTSFIPCSNPTPTACPAAIPAITYPVNVYGTLSVNQPTTVDQARYTAKVDVNVTQKDRLNGAYLYDNADSNTAYGGGDGTLGPSLLNHVRAMNAGITWSHTFNPAILNQARFSYTRHTSNFPGDPSVAGMPSVVSFLDSPTISFGNASNLPQFFTENEFVWKDDLSVTKGKHNFKGGGEFRRTRNGSSFDALKNGLFEPNDIEDVLTDAKFTDAADAYLFGGPAFGGFAAAEASINPTNNQLPQFYRGFRANEAAMYIQDDWRATSRLTLNLGVRWEYFGPPHNYLPNIDSNFYTGVPTTPAVCNFSGVSAPCNDVAAGGNQFFPVNNPFYASIHTGTVEVRNHDIWNKDLNNFGPRVGFAWDTMGNQKVVVRGGYGISYDRMYNNIFENIRFNPPYFAFSLLGTFGNGVPEGGLISPGLYTAPFTSTPLFGGAALSPSLRAMDQNLVTAYYEAAHFGVQYQLGKDTVLETNYVGTFGHKLLGILGENTYDGRYTGANNVKVNSAYSSISFRTNCCNSNYNALQVSLRKRMSYGLQLNANYTYSKALDDISDAFTTKNASGAAYPTDSMNPSFDYGPADFDVRHRAVVSLVYDLPVARGNRWLGGWSLSSIVSVQTGSPFSVTDSAIDSNGDGQFNDRATYIGSGSITHAIDHKVSPADGYLSATDWAMPNSASLPCPASLNGGLWCEGAAVGQMRRNALTGPGYFNTDLGIEKSFRITESAKISLEGNFFNIFNHPNFFIPDNNLNDAGFGKSTATFAPGPGGARVTQLALRFDF
jgi:hypothetical protein